MEMAIAYLVHLWVTVHSWNIVSALGSSCHPLQHPKNGFLLCSQSTEDGIIQRRDCRLFCDKGFYPPRDYQKSIVLKCASSGEWQPSNFVPSCIKPKRPQELKLPAEIFYSSRNCSGHEILNGIRMKFQTILQSIVRTHAACESSPGDCIVEDVLTNCIIPNFAMQLEDFTYYGHGDPVKTPRKDSKFMLPIQFHFGTRISESGGIWPDEYHKASHRLFAMFEYFERRIHSETFVIPSDVNGMLELHPLKHSITFAPTHAICDIGYTFNEDILLCIACGAGSYYDIVVDQCKPCPIGTFQSEQAQLDCQQCPVNSTTMVIGASSSILCRRTKMWSEWSNWSTCSKSCEGGVMQRKRHCALQAEHQLRDCVGHYMEEKTCNMYNCPRCKRLRRPYQGSLMCVTEREYISCNVSCRKGYAFSGPVLSQYTCGPSTLFKWPHETMYNPHGSFPACERQSRN